MRTTLQKLPKRIILDLLFLFFLSLTPLLWLKNGEIITGHDAGLPLSPFIHWQDRLNTWTNRYDGGKDQSFALAGVFIHGYEALLDLTGLPLTQQQMIQFSTYFFLIGLSMYLMFTVLFERKYHSAAVVAAITYQFNHFLLQAWFIAERTKFSVYIAVPLAISVLHLFFKRKLTPLQSSIAISVIFFVFNGGGFLPLYGASIVTLGTFTVISFAFQKEKRQTLFRLFQFTFFGLLIFSGLNSYWLLPYVRYVKGNFASEVSQAGGISGIINWIMSISENTSYLNVLRMQGIQEWYVNSEHPYAQYYREVLPLVLISFSGMIIPYLPLALNPEKKIKKTLIVFLVILLSSIFLMTGSHVPFGFLYIWMIKHIPGFIAFRTPFYKFAPGFWLSFSPLFAISVYLLSQKILFKRVPKFLIVVGSILIILLYNFPFFTINFFQYTRDRTTKVHVPSYVYDYAWYSNSPEFPFQRTLVLPGVNPKTAAYSYNWKYWSLASPLSLLDTRAYITPLEAYRFDQKVQMALLQSLINDGKDWEPLAQSLGVDSVLIQDDIEPYDYQGITVNAEIFHKALSESKNIHQVREFGEWTLYSLDYSHQFSLSPGYVTLSDSTRSFLTPSYLYSYLQLPTNLPILPKEVSNSSVPKYGDIIVPECQDCTLARQQYLTATSNPATAPGSALYPLFQLFQKNIESNKKTLLQLESETVDKNDLLFSLFSRKIEFSSRRIVWAEYKQSIEDYSETVNELLRQPPQTVLENQQLQVHLNNLISQELKLRTISNLVNQKEEADYYFDIIQKMLEMKDKILSTLLTTKTLHHNIYPVDIKDAGEYQVFIYLPSTNAEHAKGEPLTVQLDGQTLHAVTSDEWLTSEKISLSPGLHKLQVNDITLQWEPSSSADFTKPQHLEYGGRTGCGMIPLGYLDSGTYVLSFESKSTVGEVEPNFHFANNVEDIPDLAFWGIPLQVSDATWRKVNLPVEAKFSTDYQLTVCDETASETQSIDIQSIKVDRLIEPYVAVSNISPETVASIQIPTSLEFQKQSLTQFELESSPSNIPYLLSSHIPYSPFWVIDEKVEPINSNGFYNSWIIQPNKSSDELSLHYSNQNLYETGWFISGGVLILVLGSVVVMIIKRYKEGQE